MRFDAHWLAARGEGPSSTCRPRPGGPAPGGLTGSLAARKPEFTPVVMPTTQLSCRQRMSRTAYVHRTFFLSNRIPGISLTVRFWHVRFCILAGSLGTNVHFVHS